ncbi:fatty acid-binding protein, muscle-like [Leptinotarsa decemlineata]|uniref:fatty acid-binding protein, muscle-like n=1 Tax=Leptinotarsa decemlineata TaxID=7539 RepID=UPI003D30BE7D
MVDAFLGNKYKLANKYFDESMEATGVGLVPRNEGRAFSPVVDLQKDGGEYTLTSISKYKNYVITFTPGKEFDQETPDGRKVKTVVTVDGDTLTEVQTNEDGTTITIDRIFSVDEMKMITYNGDEIDMRTFKSQD